MSNHFVDDQHLDFVDDQHLDSLSQLLPNSKGWVEIHPTTIRRLVAEIRKSRFEDNKKGEKI